MHAARQSTTDINMNWYANGIQWLPEILAKIHHMAKYYSAGI
jgi:hypothetical protein